MTAQTKKYVKYAVIGVGVLVALKIIDDAATAAGNSAGTGIGKAAGTIATGAVVVGGAWATVEYILPALLLL